jgi:hypothetical protein
MRIVYLSAADDTTFDARTGAVCWPSQLEVLREIDTEGRMKPWPRFGLAVALMVGSSAASAASCAEFTDVDSLDAFCPNVEWLRNRAITLGCTSTSVFCPANAVTRIQLAAFMNRLGTALTPFYVSLSDTDPGDLGPGASDMRDRRSDLPGLSETRRGGYGGVGIRQHDGPGRERGRHVQHQRWRDMSQPASIGVSMRVAPVGNIILPMQGLPLPLNVGTTYRFSVFVSTNSGPPGTAVASCNLRLRFENRNGASSPF